MADTPAAPTETPAPVAPAAPVAPVAPASAPAPPAPAPSSPSVLDLAGEPERPLVKLPAGDFRMRTPEELTFEQFGFQVRAGKKLIEKAPDVDKDGVLDELQTIIAEAAKVILVGLDDAAARTITPGQFQRISLFFNELAGTTATPASNTGASSSGGASASSETSATA